METIESHAPTGLGYYVWWFPGSPAKVHLSLDVVRRLREQLQLAGPKAAEEGLLFGKTIEGATEVLDFQPAAGRVPEAVATLAKDGGKRLLVGYYRTEAGDSLRLTDSDFSLARTCFPQPYHVFLVIQPIGFGPPNASFFFHDGTGKMAEVSLMEFPFDPSLLAGEERDRLRRSQEAAARRAAAIQPAAPAPRRSRDRRPVVAVLALLGLLISGAGISAKRSVLEEWWSRFRRTRADPAAAPGPVAPLSVPAMGLRARRENGDVAITWNREAAVIAAATSGILSIQDGNDRRDIALDATQVRSSSVMYSPTTDQVSIQLAITTPVNTIIESVVLLLPNNEPAKVYTAPIPKPAATREPAATRTVKPFTPPSTAARSEPEIPPPLLPSRPGVGVDPNSIPTLIAQSTMLPAPERIAGAPLNGAPDAPADTPPSTSRPAVYRPAEPIRKVVPRLPPQLLTMMPKPGTVEVRVVIDKAGRVTQAEAVPHRGVTNLVLDRLVTAARSWTFTPARRGEEPLASEFVIQFHFAQ